MATAAFRPDLRASERYSPPLPAAPRLADWQPSRYHASGRHRAPAALLAGGAVLALLSSLMWIHAEVPHRAEPRMVTLDLGATPPPPPSPPVPTTRPTPEAKPRAASTAPTPIVAPLASPVVAAPASAPVPVPPAPVPAASPAAPAPVAAPAPSATPVDGGDLSSRLLSAKPPAYPLDSRRKREQGTVVLDVLLSTEGVVSDISVAETSGFDRLDHAALAAVRDWRWKPLTRDGAPVAVRGRVRIPFVLKA